MWVRLSHRAGDRAIRICLRLNGRQHSSVSNTLNPTKGRLAGELMCLSECVGE